MYNINKHYDQTEKPEMRPLAKTVGVTKVDQEAYFNIRSYLVDPTDEIIDEDGNTSIHVFANSENLQEYGETLKNNPQMLFMLNKEGFSSLDVAIKE